MDSILQKAFLSLIKELPNNVLRWLGKPLINDSGYELNFMFGSRAVITIMIKSDKYLVVGDKSESFDHSDYLLVSKTIVGNVEKYLNPDNSTPEDQISVGEILNFIRSLRIEENSSMNISE